MDNIYSINVSGTEYSIGIGNDSNCFRYYSEDDRFSLNASTGSAHCYAYKGLSFRTGEAYPILLTSQGSITMSSKGGFLARDSSGNITLTAGNLTNYQNAELTLNSTDGSSLYGYNSLTLTSSNGGYESTIKMDPHSITLSPSMSNVTIHLGESSAVFRVTVPSDDYSLSFGQISGLSVTCAKFSLVTADSRFSINTARLTYRSMCLFGGQRDGTDRFYDTHNFVYTAGGVVIQAMYGYLSSSYTNYNTTTFLVCGGASAGTRKNALRVAGTKVYLATSYQSSGAGITELFEWLDGNPDNEDRVGHFVTLIGEKIRYAEPEDGYVLGAVDPNPTVVGDNGETWHGMHKKDVFGRNITERVFVPKEVDKDGNVLWEDHYEDVEIMGEDFDSSKPYVERWERQEYATISSKGKVVLIDDGTCQVDKFATVGPGGIATHSDDNVAVRVMKRVDDTHVKVFIDASFLVKH